MAWLPAFGFGLATQSTTLEEGIAGGE
jgi:hypothetical protein